MGLSVTRRTFVAGSASVAALAASRSWAQGNEIVLGATVPLTGPLAASGQQYHFALQLAQDDINAKGGIGGKKVKIVFEDTQASNSVAVNAFIKLAKELNPPFIFLSSYSTQNLATEPEVSKAKIPTMYAGGADVIHQRKNPYMFRLRPYDTVTTTALARTVLNLVAPDRPGLLADVAHVLRDQQLRVQDARIATFGERAEDQFQLTDRHDRPLTETSRQALRDALLACLEPDRTPGDPR